MTNDDLKKIADQTEMCIPRTVWETISHANVLLLLAEVKRLNAIIDKWEKFGESVIGRGLPDPDTFGPDLKIPRKAVTVNVIDLINTHPYVHNSPAEIRYVNFTERMERGEKSQEADDGQE